MDIKEILRTEKVDRIESDLFFLRMYLRANVAFFKELQHDSLIRLFKKIETHHFKQGDVISRTETPQDKMYIVMFGSVGLYDGTWC